MSKPKFRTGYVAGWTQEERLFALRLFKFIDKKAITSDFEKRMLRRLIARFMGQPLHRFPLYEDRECPICERTFRGKGYEPHVIRCKEKQLALKRVPKIDPEVWEMLGGEL